MINANRTLLGSSLGTLVFGVWTLAATLLSFIGGLATLRDLQAQGLLPALVAWLLSTPIWAPAIAALAFAVWFAKAIQGINGAPAEPAPNQTATPLIGPGGAGGNASVTGNNSRATGGKGGDGGVYHAGSAGGDAHLASDNSLLIGGNGGHGGTVDGRGGRPARSPMYGNMTTPTFQWRFGQGGAGANHPEYDRRLHLLIAIRKEYLEAFEQDAPFIEAGVDQVPAAWVNKRLEEVGEVWRISGECPYILPPIFHPR